MKFKTENSNSLISVGIFSSVNMNKLRCKVNSEIDVNCSKYEFIFIF